MKSNAPEREINSCLVYRNKPTIKRITNKLDMDINKTSFLYESPNPSIYLRNLFAIVPPPDINFGHSRYCDMNCYYFENENC